MRILISTRKIGTIYTKLSISFVADIGSAITDAIFAINIYYNADNANGHFVQMVI